MVIGGVSTCLETRIEERNKTKINSIKQEIPPYRVKGFCLFKKKIG